MNKQELLEILANYMPYSPLYDEPVIDTSAVSLYMGNALEAWEWLTHPDMAPALCVGAQQALTRAVYELAHAPDKLRALPLLTSYPAFKGKFFCFPCCGHAGHMESACHVARGGTAPGAPLAYQGIF